MLNHVHGVWGREAGGKGGAATWLASGNPGHKPAVHDILVCSGCGRHPAWWAWQQQLWQDAALPPSEVGSCWLLPECEFQGRLDKVARMLRPGLPVCSPCRQGRPLHPSGARSAWVPLCCGLTCLHGMRGARRIGDGCMAGAEQLPLQAECLPRAAGGGTAGWRENEEIAKSGKIRALDGRRRGRAPCPLHRAAQLGTVKAKRLSVQRLHHRPPPRPPGPPPFPHSGPGLPVHLYESIGGPPGAVRCLYQQQNG